MISAVVLISGNGSNLQEIITHCHNTTINIEAVFCDQPLAYGLVRAYEAGITAISTEQINTETREEYCGKLSQGIHLFNPKLVILAGFMKILTPAFVDRYEIINIHPSLLPKYPGLNTHARVLEANETEHGITIHKVDHGMDTGEIIFQTSCPVYITDTKESLEYRIHQLEHMWYPKIINDIARSLDLNS